MLDHEIEQLIQERIDSAKKEIIEELASKPNRGKTALEQDMDGSVIVEGDLTVLGDLTIRGPKDKVGVLLGRDKFGGLVRVADGEGHPRVVLEAGEDGGLVSALRDSDTLAVNIVSTDSGGSVGVWDKSGNLVGLFGADEDRGSFSIKNSKIIYAHTLCICSLICRCQSKAKTDMATLRSRYVL